MKPKDIKKGDIVVYRSGRVNHVNKPKQYARYYDDNFENWGLGREYGIIMILRYEKFLCFYKLKTIYEKA